MEDDPGSKHDLPDFYVSGNALGDAHLHGCVPDYRV
jgi:hypothetical protein